MLQKRVSEVIPQQTRGLPIRSIVQLLLEMGEGGGSHLFEGDREI